MVSKAESQQRKWRPLERMFNEVPGRYDLLNRIITWGQDERWRKHAAKECLSGNPAAILDLCTGTGDLALQIAKRCNGSVHIHALDYSEPMLAVARRKADKDGIGRIQFKQGDAAAMPYESGSLDSVGIAFAFRNLTYKNPDREKFLAEVLRVLKDQGSFVIVESSQPSNRVYQIFFRIYLRVFVAGLGGWISGHRGAYRYLAASARNFYTPKEVLDMLLKAGFRKVSHRSFMGGVAGLTIASK
jgi:demethylmenaquinone methyltransferase/2-methoxy-6-polyprenyl-1,4-benzoquinol methylase